MFDKVRIETLLNRVENAILLIQSKAGQLETPNDFLLDKEGTFLLSGICMQLIFIVDIFIYFVYFISYCYF